MHLNWDLIVRCTTANIIAIQEWKIGYFFCVCPDRKELFVPTLNGIPVGYQYVSSAPVVPSPGLNDQLTHLK